LRLKELINALKAYKPKIDLSRANAAVNIVLRGLNDEVEVLMIKRVISPNDPWSGDVAFPGGRMEPLDATIYDTALRETFEEVGIPRDKLEIIGFLEPVTPLNVPEYIVLPVISILKSKDVSLRLGGEVEKAFWVNLSHIGEEVEIKHPRRDVLVRAYVYKGEVIWGMTKRILNNLLRIYRSTFT